MIYEETVNIPNRRKVVKHDVASCVECGNDDIDISIYEDKYGFFLTAICKKCKQEIGVNFGWSVLNAEHLAIVALVKKWNEQNDIDQLLKAKKALIAKTQAEIKQLTKLKAQRKKTKKK